MKTVLLHSLTAFGGPQMHFLKMHRLFVQKHKYVSENELLELNAFVQLLPGASSSQTLTLIGYKRGGIILATLTLLIWIFPACTLMGSLSFLLRFIDQQKLPFNIFKYVQPMAVGFLAYSAFESFKISIKHHATLFIMAGAMLVTAFIKSPWVFPALIILGSVISNFSNKRIPDAVEKPKPIKWGNISLFVFIFIAAGIISETARIHNWEMRKPINLFENFYRFGSLVFGGGSVLIPMMFEQYVIRDKTNYISPGHFLTGAGMVQALPGPIFSIAAFVGGMVMRHLGTSYQLLGCVIGSFAIFLPSLLLVIFFYPIWQNLKKYVVAFRAMEGINAVVVGIIWASAILLFISISKPFNLLNLLAVILTFIILKFTKIPSPIIVVIFLVLALLF